MQLQETTQCPHCQSNKIIKNGKTYYGKQNHKCKNCKRQFVERNLDPIEAYKNELLPLLLLERISLRGHHTHFEAWYVLDIQAHGVILGIAAQRAPHWQTLRVGNRAVLH